MDEATKTLRAEYKSIATMTIADTGCTVADFKNAVTNAWAEYVDGEDVEITARQWVRFAYEASYELGAPDYTLL